MTRRALIYGINYAPEEIGIAPYTTGLASHLARTGWDVTVVTGVPHYPDWRVPASYGTSRRRDETVDGVAVRRLRHYVPARQSALRRGGYEASFFLNALAAGRISRPDVVLGVVPSLSGGVLAALTARRYQAPFGIVIQDLMGAAARQSGIRGGGRVTRLTGAIEGWVARRADGIATVSDAFHQTVLGFGVDPSRIVHLRNWSRIAAPARQRTETRRELGWAEGDQVLLHAGNMGLKQGLDHVIEAARRAAPGRPHLRFVLMGSGSQRAALEARAARLPNVEFLDPRPIDQLADTLAAADALLVNERASVIDMSLPSKLTSYFVAGRPVIAAVAEGATAAEIRRAGAGLVVPAEQPEALLAALDDLRADPALAEQLGAAGRAYADTVLDRQSILCQADTFIAQLLASRPAAVSAIGVPTQR
jgi:glycosyltransferase involved in cell wall biosynthesis